MATQQKKAPVENKSKGKVSYPLGKINFIMMAVCLLLIIIGLSAYLGTIPLIKAAKCAQNGEAIPVTGAKEFRYLASSYNKLTGAKENNEDDDD